MIELLKLPNLPKLLGLITAVEETALCERVFEVKKISWAAVRMQFKALTTDANPQLFSVTFSFNGSDWVIHRVNDIADDLFNRLLRLNDDWHCGDTVYVVIESDPPGFEEVRESRFVGKLDRRVVLYDHHRSYWMPATHVFRDPKQAEKFKEYVKKRNLRDVEEGTTNPGDSL